MNNCYDLLGNISNQINTDYNYGLSHDNLDYLASINKIDQLIESNFIDVAFREELLSFLYLLNTDAYNGNEGLRKILLHESNFVKILQNGNYDYILSLYLKNKEAYRVFPLFVRACMEKYNLYDNDIDKKLYEKLDISRCYDPNSKRNLAEVLPKSTRTDYNSYDAKLRTCNLKVDNITDFFVWSEYTAYLEEYNFLSNYKEYNVNALVRWVSRYHGDGYGYDVLSYDPYNRKEKQIEVKSTRTNYLILTKTELETLYKTQDYNNTDYYIYKYYYDYRTDKINPSRLIFDKERELFFDIANPSDIYRISPRFFYENNVTKVGALLLTEADYQKVLTR